MRVHEYMDVLRLQGDTQVNHAFQLSDEQYARLAAYAAQYKQTPETLFQTWVNEMTQKVKESATSNLSKQKEREEDESNSPLFRVAGMFAIGEPGWADKHDEYLAETYIEDHANKQ
jgi:hypothetical protein